MPIEQVPFVALGRQYEHFRDEILEAFDRISRSGQYVLSEEVELFESEFATYCNSKYAVSVGNGSDALLLPFLSLGIEEGDEIITAPNSFVASAWTIHRTGAKIVFADVGDDFNLEPDSVRESITSKTKGILAVHLTGRIAQMESLIEIADEYGISVYEDAAQAVGATRNGKKAGSFGKFSAFSLHPLKNLHVHGDGGIITTDDSNLSEHLKKCRNHGLKNRNECEFWGVNTRLDAIQAAIARIKLKHIDTINGRMRSIAQTYRQELCDFVRVPGEHSNEKPVYHRFMIRHERRDSLKDHLAKCGVQSAINYPIPLHLHEAAKELGYQKGDFENAETQAKEIISLPLFSEMEESEIDYVIQSIKSFF
ncbi:MAG: DegT/DnrJ/EryC1/StrS family aminotransferase [Opitutales bacterium]|nr:DegT/DnrJ/EryC1/StrS family aminotransferase [Opitutales bacterium]